MYRITYQPPNALVEHLWNWCLKNKAPFPEDQGHDSKGNRLWTVKWDPFLAIKFALDVENMTIRKCKTEEVVT